MTSYANARRTGRSVLAGSFLIAASRGTTQVAQILTFLVAARVLAPADFGTYALVSTVAMLAAVAANAGWSGYILSLREGPEAVRQVLFLSALSGLAVALVGIAASEVGLGDPGSPAVDSLVLLFSLWVFVAACAEGQVAVLVRQERLSAAALCQLTAELVGLAGTMWLLWSGFGVLSLAYGRLAAQSVQLSGTLAASRTLPTFRLSRDVVRGATTYSAHMLAVRVIGTARASLGIFVVGGFLGVEAAGYFRLAQRLIGAVYDIVYEPARSAAWVVFREAATPYDDPGEPRARAALQQAAERFVPILYSLSAPVFIGISLVAGDLLALLLGEVWRPAGSIASILAIGCLFPVATCLSEPLLAITGNIRYLPKVTMSFAVISLAVIIPCGMLGLHAVVWGQLALDMTSFLMMLWVQVRILGLNWRRIGSACLFLLPLLAAMAAAAMLLDHLAAVRGLEPLPALVLTAVPAAVLYLAALALFRADYRGQVARALRRS